MDARVTQIAVHAVDFCDKGRAALRAHIHVELFISALFTIRETQVTDLCWPSYSFSVDVGNFLALDDFVAFKNQFALGDKVYINLGDKILAPIAIGVEVNFEKLSDFKLLFGDKYSLKDSAFKLVDLLEESIKMGKSTASSKVSYSSFIDSGASTYVKDFMDSALDAAKNAVLAGANQEIKIEESGIRLRSYDNDSGTYGDEQIWMINNTIAFTDDNWSSAKMAIGKIFDNNLARYEKTKDTVRDESKTYYVDTDGTEWNPNGATAWSRDLYEKVHEGSAYGIAAPYLVGTVIAGSNLIMESAKQDGGKAVFRVDADGAKLYNSRFDLAKDCSEGGTNATGLISLNPGVGLVGGKSAPTAPLFSYDDQGNVNGVVLADGKTTEKNLTSLNKDNLPNASFWVDMLGNAYLKGTIYATDGVFSGELKAASGTFSGTVKAAKFEGDSSGELIGPAIYVPNKKNPKFSVDSSGKVTIIRVRFAGRRDRLAPDLVKSMGVMEDETRGCDALTLTICADYGGHDAIARAVQSGAKTVHEIDEALTAEIPTPDAILRTGGEMRLSNFLLWQAAYAELFFSPTMFPALEDSELDALLEEYSTRTRKFGV